MSKQKCYSCKAFGECLAYVIDDNNVERCSNFELLKNQVDDTIKKFNSLSLPYHFSEQEIKSMIFFSNTGTFGGS